MKCIRFENENPIGIVHSNQLEILGEKLFKMKAAKNITSTTISIKLLIL